MAFRSFRAIQEHLDGLGMFHMELGLGRIRRVLAALGLERPPFAVVQVLGTNGKGSTSAFLESLCAAHGCRTGLYTSPHFVSPEERIRVNGTPLPGRLWPPLANAVLAAAGDGHLTYFEFLTALALLAFRETGVEVAILEAGLGGRNDATTAVTADLLCFTPIAVDHAAVIGPTLAHIARDKAAAIRSGAPVCSAPQYPLAAAELAAAAARYGAEITVAAPLAPQWLPRLGLAGSHQLVNAAVARGAWRHLAPLLDKSADDTAQALGLGRAFLPGRLQRLPRAASHPALLVDGAHNPHGMQALVRALGSGCEAGPRAMRPPAAIIFSCLGDKDWRSSAALLRRHFSHAPVFVPALANPRAADAGEVAAFFAALSAAPVIPVGGADAVGRALAAAADICATQDGVALMTGSLYLLAEFFGRYPRYLTSSLPPLEPQP